VECGAGTITELDTAVWALGIPFPTQLLLRGEREGTQPAWGEFYIFIWEGMTAPVGKNLRRLGSVCLVRKPFSSVELCFISKSTQVPTLLSSSILHPTKPVFFILLLTSIILF
jgi:hypothetical protein